MRKKKEYKAIENGIEYLVVESYGYYYLNKYHSERNYDETYIKFIINFDKMKEEIYLMNNMDHNIYGPSFIRYLGNNLIAQSYALYGKHFNNYEDWLKENTKLSRKLKLKQLMLFLNPS